MSDRDTSTTDELMRVADEFGASLCLSDIARLVKPAPDAPGLSLDGTVEAVRAAVRQRDELREAAWAVLSRLDYLQGLWGKEVISDGLTRRLREAVASPAADTDPGATSHA